MKNGFFFTKRKTPAVVAPASLFKPKAETNTPTMDVVSKQDRHDVAMASDAPALLNIQEQALPPMIARLPPMIARLPQIYERTSVTAEEPEVQPKQAAVVVGRGIKMRGVEINECDMLSIEGSMEADVNAKVLCIAEGGSFSGTAVVDSAFIHGVFEGTLVVRQRLSIYATGQVLGTVRYVKMVIQEGGTIFGHTELLEGRILSVGC